MKNNYLIFIFLSLAFVGFSQQKFEKEYRIKEVEAPQKSRDFISSIAFVKKIKWYAEESNDGKSFEAKTCHNKNLYSIEFSKNGQLLDIEKKVKFSKLATAVKDKITTELAQSFRKFKIKKTQIQYKGLEPELKKVFETSDRTKFSARIFYELIVKGKKDSDFFMYEILFDEKGNKLKELKFKVSNSINLEF